MNKKLGLRVCAVGMGALLALGGLAPVPASAADPTPVRAINSGESLDVEAYWYAPLDVKSSKGYLYEPSYSLDYSDDFNLLGSVTYSYLKGGVAVASGTIGATPSGCDYGSDFCFFPGPDSAVARVKSGKYTASVTLTYCEKEAATGATIATACQTVTETDAFKMGSNSPVVTTREYKKVHKGWTYSKIKKLVGGTPLIKGHVHNKQQIMWWDGYTSANGSEWAAFGFKKGKLVAKAYNGHAPDPCDSGVYSSDDCE